MACFPRLLQPVLPPSSACSSWARASLSCQSLGMRICHSLWGQSPVVLPQPPACGYWDVETGAQHSLALNLLQKPCQPWQHTSLCRRQRDVWAPGTDICRSATVPWVGRDALPSLCLLPGFAGENRVESLSVHTEKLRYVG